MLIGTWNVAALSPIATRYRFATAAGSLSRWSEPATRPFN
jgi:hypothetical protein